MSLSLVSFGTRENGDPQKKVVRETDYGQCTFMDNFYEEEAAKGDYAQYDGAIFSRYTVTAEMLAQLGGSLAVTRFGAGVDAIDPVAATDQGKLIVSTHTYGPETIAEHADRLLLSARGWGPFIHEYVKTKDWNDQKVTFFPDIPSLPTIESTLGIFGLGEIGRASAHRQQGKWKQILACDPYPDPNYELAKNGIVKYVEFDELLSECDAILCHCAHTESSHFAFDKAAFRKMKNAACFVNVARGGVMVDADLAEALDAGEIGSAGLDVFVDEPLKPDSPLLAYANSDKGKNIVLSPHVAAAITKTARSNIGTHSFDSLVRAVRLQQDNSLPWDQWPRSIINFDLVKSYPAYDDWKKNSAPCLRWRLIEAGEL